jgi:hypothetical protein
MVDHESQEEDDPNRILIFKRMSCLGKIVGAQIPVIPEKSLVTCGWRKFQLDPLGDHLNTCTTHSGAKKTHDWMVDQITDLFRTTHKVKTQQVIKSRGQHCGESPQRGHRVRGITCE